METPPRIAVSAKGPPGPLEEGESVPAPLVEPGIPRIPKPISGVSDGGSSCGVAGTPGQVGGGRQGLLLAPASQLRHSLENQLKSGSAGINELSMLSANISAETDSIELIQPALAGTSHQTTNTKSNASPIADWRAACKSLWLSVQKVIFPKFRDELKNRTRQLGADIASRHLTLQEFTRLRQHPIIRPSETEQSFGLLRFIAYEATIGILETA